MAPRRNPAREARLAEVVERAQLAAARTVRGLFRKPDEPGYNPDAASTWKDCRTVTRAALILTQGVMAAERAKQAAQTAPASFNLVIMPSQIESAKDWEAFAQQQVIEAAVVREEPKK